MSPHSEKDNVLTVRDPPMVVPPERTAPIKRHENEVSILYMTYRLSARVTNRLSLGRNQVFSEVSLPNRPIGDFRWPTCNCRTIRPRNCSYSARCGARSHGAGRSPGCGGSFRRWEMENGNSKIGNRLLNIWIHHVEKNVFVHNRVENGREKSTKFILRLTHGVCQNRVHQRTDYGFSVVIIWRSGNNLSGCWTPYNCTFYIGKGFKLVDHIRTITLRVNGGAEVSESGNSNWGRLRSKDCQAHGYLRQ